jgi:hypothetical protein
MVDKYIVDGKVAVLYSPNYGAGWSTWNKGYEDFLMFDSEIVKFLLQRDFNSIERYVNNLYDGLYLCGLYDLEISYLPIGTVFRIDEYDGYESIEIYDQKNYSVA